MRPQRPHGWFIIVLSRYILVLRWRVDLCGSTQTWELLMTSCYLISAFSNSQILLHWVFFTWNNIIGFTKYVQHNVIVSTHTFHYHFLCSYWAIQLFLLYILLSYILELFDWFSTYNIYTLKSCLNNSLWTPCITFITGHGYLSVM